MAGGYSAQHQPETVLSTFKADVTASLPAFRVSKPSRLRLMSPLFSVTLLGLSVTSGQSGLTSQVAIRTSTRGSARDIADLSAGALCNSSSRYRDLNCPETQCCRPG